MIALALRGLRARRLRSALTGIAVVLGVAMIAGTLAQAGQIRGAFDDIMATAYEGVDVEVAPERAFQGNLQDRATLPAELVRRVEAVPGVRKAAGQLEESGQLVVDGRAVGSSNIAVVSSVPPAPFNPLRVSDGRLPSGPREIAINRQLAEGEGIEPGARHGVATALGVVPVEVVGVFDYGAVSSVGGASLIAATLPEVQRWYEAPGRLSTITVQAEPGVRPEALVQRLEGALPGELTIRTGEQSAREQADEINDQIGSFLTPVLLALSGAALLVGAFIIFNTFSITVAQRTKEFALLRTLGATRRQVLQSVVAEAAVIGVTASLAGIAVGLLFARALNALFDAAGFGIPVTGLGLTAGTVATALLVGLGVTLLGAIFPAVRATRVAPLAALREEVATPSARRRRFAPWIAGGTAALGVALLGVGLFGGGAATTTLTTMGVGTILLFVGVALLARHVVRPVASVLGWPLERIFRTQGRLARENAMRSPGRTATTAAALMVGLGLVVFVAVFAAGLRSAFTESIDATMRGDLIVRTDQATPIPIEAGRTLEEVPGVATVASVYFDQVQVDGRPMNAVTDTMEGVDPTTLRETYTFDWVEGSDALLGRLAGDAALVEEQFAKTHGIGIGDRFTVEPPSGRRLALRAIGRYRDPQLLQGFMVARDTFLRASDQLDPLFYMASVAPGADPDAVLADAQRALERFPVAEVSSIQGFKDAISRQLDQVVYLLYALLALTLLISLFGIANSLFLSIHERTRELGLLRAVGATRAQVRRIVRYESVITSALGGLMGTAIGVLLAALFTQALSDLGLGLSIPVVQLAIFFVVAMGVGVVAAMLPARQAARLDVLEALHQE